MSSRDDAVVAGFAGVAAVAGSYAAAGFTPGFVAAPLTDLIRVVSPAGLIAWAIENLGSLAQRLVLLGAVALALLVLSAAAYGGLAAARRRGHAFYVPLVTAPLQALVVYGLTGHAPGALLAALAGAAVATLGRPTDGERSPVSPLPRRHLLRGGAGAVGAAGIGYWVGRGQSGTESSDGDGPDGEPAAVDPEVQRLLDAAAEKSLEVEGLEGLVSDGFYQVDINPVNPVVEADSWTLTVTGDVDESTTFTYEELRAREDAVHRYETLRCVGEQLNGYKMDNAVWSGVPVAPLLEEAGVPDNCCVMLRAADSYFEEFPLAALEDAMLAYDMNGETLPRAHGFPVRAIVPGHWGEISVKWITEVEILEEPQEGYWERQGWHGTGPVNTVAKLHEWNRDETTMTLGGHAYAGTRGIQTVEVSIDGGQTWTEATLSDPLEGDNVWRMWKHEYEREVGEHEVVVRAVDGTGALQPREDQQPFPSGATGWVSKTVY